jgi:hypothetical protein
MFASKLVSSLSVAMLIAMLDIRADATLPFSRVNAPVFTVAGSGKVAMRDGPAMSASFLLPTGVAADRAGNVFVADEAAERILKIDRSGFVKTVAGSGPLQKLGFSVEGGFRDGPASSARFNHPTAIAIGPDGGIFVADSKNSCIREVKNGIVSTVVGKPGESIVRDGDGSSARLVLPRTLSFDQAGNLWIGDFNGGLRELDKDRVLRTVVLTYENKPYTDFRFLSISASQINGDATIVIALPDHFLVYDSSTQSLSVNNEAEAEGSRPFGRINQIAYIGHGQAVFTDATSNVIRYLRLAPVIASMNSDIVAGGNNEHGNENAGYADGSLADSRFFAPMGLAVIGDRLIVADAGNHRIRSIQLPEFTTPEYGLDGATTYDSAHYEIVYIGSSVVFYDTVGPKSICRVVEARLNHSGGLRLPARCHTVRINAASDAAVESYISSYLSGQKIDLIIMNAHPGESPGQLAALRSVLNDLSRETKFMIFWQYDSPTFSIDESLFLKEAQAPFSDQFPEENSETILSRRAADRRELEGLRVSTCDIYDQLLAYELKPGHLPLYGSAESHTSPRGNVFIGNAIADCLISGRDNR